MLSDDEKRKLNIFLISIGGWAAEQDAEQSANLIKCINYLHLSFAKQGSYALTTRPQHSCIALIYHSIPQEKKGAKKFFEELKKMPAFDPLLVFNIDSEMDTLDQSPCLVDLPVALQRKGWAVTVDPDGEGAVSPLSPEFLPDDSEEDDDTQPRGLRPVETTRPDLDLLDEAASAPLLPDDITTESNMGKLAEAIQLSFQRVSSVPTQKRKASPPPEKEEPDSDDELPYQPYSSCFETAPPKRNQPPMHMRLSQKVRKQNEEDDDEAMTEAEDTTASDKSSEGEDKGGNSGGGLCRMQADTPDFGDAPGAFSSESNTPSQKSKEVILTTNFKYRKEEKSISFEEDEEEEEDDDVFLPLDELRKKLEEKAQSCNNDDEEQRHKIEDPKSSDDAGADFNNSPEEDTAIFAFPQAQLSSKDIKYHPAPPPEALQEERDTNQAIIDGVKESWKTPSNASQASDGGELIGKGSELFNAGIDIAGSSI
jgi:hypothetical protein